MPVTATVDKKPDTKLGLSIKRSSVTGTTRIGKISDGGLFASTDLKEGMKVVSINETRVAGMELNDILEVLKSAEGKVTIVAETEDEVAAGVTAAAASSGASVGSASQQQARPSMTKQISNKSTGSAGPKEVTATVVKESPEQKLGISLKRNPADGSTVIGRVNPDGLFGKSKLKEGMHVVSINNVGAKESSLQDLLAVMTTAAGPITILAKDASSAAAVSPKRSSFSNLFGAAAAPPAEAAKLVTAVVNKTSPDDKLGVSIKRMPSTGVTVVGKVAPDGLFAKTGLKEGMKVLKVNNRDVNLMELNDLLLVLKESSGMITILAEAPPPSQAARSASVSSVTAPMGPPKRITAVVAKTTPEDKLGVSLRRASTSGVTVVGKVSDQGLFAKTELKEGMTVVSVNDKAVKDMELQELLSMLKDSTGDVTIVAETPGYSPAGSITRAASSPSVVSSVAPPRRVTATVDKDTAEKKLGISIRRTSVSGTTLVGRVSPEGPFAASGLEEGMKVVAIKAGGKDLTDMELEGMLDSLRTATGEVTIVAETMTGPASVARSTSVARASSVAGFKPLPPPEGAGHSVIFKKTFKQKGMGNVSQALSFHGQGVDKAMIDTVNRHLGAIRYCATANPLKFTKDDKSHYVVEMNHDCQKYHEEDALAAVFDAMEVLGWGFRFQYASQYQTSTSSHTFRDIFIFAKLIEI